MHARALLFLAISALLVQGCSSSISGIAVCGTSGGTLTFEEIAGDQLRITIDNTTDGSTDLDPTLGVYENSAAITGFVFNIVQEITSATVLSFKDGSNNTISGWTLGLNVNSSITPGNTVFDVQMASGNIKNGIYNAADPGSNIANVVPDIAILTIQINQPTNWDLVEIGDDSILRMQRVGLRGAGSLKIPSSSSGGTPFEVPEPGSSSLVLLGLGLLGASLWSRRRSMQS